MTDIQQLVSQLQAALGTDVVTGTLYLNLNQRRLESVKAETYHRIPKDGLDKAVYNRERTGAA